MKENKISVLIYIVSVFVSCTYAQERQITSLLSNYGLGHSFSEATVAEKAQGGLSVVNNNVEEVISITNPALLSHLKLTSFALSLNALGNKMTTTNNSYTGNAISLSNLSLGIPLGRKGGVSFGLRANSAVGFKVDTSDFYNFGNGGVNDVYLGFGYNIFKGLSLGAQINRSFGKIEKRQVFKDVRQATVYDNNYNVSGTSIRLGAEYTYPVSEKLEATVGMTGILAHNISAKGTSRFFEAIETKQNIFSDIGNKAQEKSINGVNENPLKTIVGIGLGEKNRWFTGLSYENQKAMSYSGKVFYQTISSEMTTSFEAYNKIILGGYFIPKKYSLKSYSERVAYRAGLQYGNTGLILNNSSVKNIGMSFGLGLPIGRGISYLNFSVQLGKIGNVSKNKYQEEYINVGVNFSLSDKWFKKRVID